MRHTDMRTRTIGALVGLVLGALGCGDSTGPESRALPVGRYTYTSALGTGTVTITRATADSLVGQFDVPTSTGALSGPWRLGAWNIDAYALFVDEIVPGVTPRFVRAQYTHRVTRDDCQYKLVPSSDVLRPCRLAYLGP